MDMKRKFDDLRNSDSDRQRQRQLYASRNERCDYHDILGRSLSTESTRIIPASGSKPSIIPFKDLYKPLDPFQIRVLHVEAGNCDEPLKTSLSNVDLLLEGGVVDPANRRRYAYEAISYNWGDHPATAVVQCNDKFVALRESQYTMLQHLRDVSEQRCIWFDAICINQADLDERAAQVSKMFTIFKHAKRVLIWLGTPKPRTALTFDAVAKMRAMKLMQMLDRDEFSVLRFPTKETEFVPNMCSKCHGEFVMGIEELSTFPWFRRTWVRQEVFASQETVLLCGRLAISWPELTRHIIVFATRLNTTANTAQVEMLKKQLGLLNPYSGRMYLDADDHPTGSMSFVYQLFDQQATQHPLIGKDLFCVLANSKRFEASDPRDIIYGVLGMSNARTFDLEDGQPFLKVNYKCTATQIFCEVTEYFIRRERNLDAMFLAQFNRDPHSKTPSWCPYWPVLDCEPEEIRELCHVHLLDKHSNFRSPAFFDTFWPAVINAEVIDVKHSAHRYDLCTFDESRMRIGGHVLGLIRAQDHVDGPSRLSLVALEKSVFRETSTIVRNGKQTSESCSAYTTLHIDHALAHLNAFIEHGAKTATMLQEEIDRFCLACVPTTTRDGDLLCFLEASSAFVVLRPLKLKRYICRVHFIGVAFISQDIFEMSKLVRCSTSRQTLKRTRSFEQAQHNIETFKRIIRDSVEGENDQHQERSPGTPDLSSKSPTAISDESDDVTFRRSSKPISISDPVLTASNENLKCSRRLERVFQRHFDGPMESLKMTFDIN